MSSREKGEPEGRLGVEGSPEVSRGNKRQRHSKGWAWWHSLRTPAFRWQRQEDSKFEDSMSYLVSTKPVRAT